MPVTTIGSAMLVSIFRPALQRQMVPMLSPIFLCSEGARALLATWTSAAVMQRKLYKMCVWAVKHAVVSIARLKPLQKFVECALLEKLRIVAKAHLARVDIDDAGYIEQLDLNEAAARSARTPPKQSVTPTAKEVVVLGSGNDTDSGLLALLNSNSTIIGFVKTTEAYF